MQTLAIKDDASFQEALRILSAQAVDPAAESRLAEKTDAARAIVEAVRSRGDAAVAEFTERYDGVAVSPDQFELTREEIDAAAREVEPSLLAALERAHENIRRFHSKNLRQSWEEVDEDGTVLGQRVSTIESAGVYVPGGTAFYPSTVLMNIVPARVAGVQEIVMVSPPSYNGTIHPLVLAAARLAGATRIFRVGGAQSIAALAYGTEHIPAVLKITGPGNIYVTMAKRLVSTVCDIDKEAGPSEVLVIADEKANARLVAIELIAQAEHDEDACATLVTTSAELARKVQNEIDRLLPTLSRVAIIRKSLEGQGKIIIVQNEEQAVRLANEMAPEHLALHVAYPRKLFERIKNAGAVMLGAYTPVAVGDYYAGPNHILPTGRRARFASPLTAEDFRKVTNFISYSRERLRKAADDICMLAEAEKLTAHARAVELRK
ncbi:MAG: histidinol dehydrogenase [Candidatus Hydrogenedentes bacterium]|nr:histidinol dehydrogenase [Candidatus Hydrogenedentota bacterium]